jgi:uncharacterized protein YkwD
MKQVVGQFIQIVILVVISLLLADCSSEEPQPQRMDLRSELLGAINTMRNQGCQCGQDLMPPVPELTWNDTLEKTSDTHVRDMYLNKYFSHLSQDGTPPIIRAQRAGYEGEYVGENIARGYTRIIDVMDGWKESESHCKTLMDTLYNEMGASETGGYWVLDLGRSN